MRRPPPRRASSSGDTPSHTTPERGSARAPRPPRGEAAEPPRGGRGRAAAAGLGGPPGRPAAPADRGRRDQAADRPADRPAGRAAAAGEAGHRPPQPARPGAPRGAPGWAPARTRRAGTGGEDAARAVAPARGDARRRGATGVPGGAPEPGRGGGRGEAPRRRDDARPQARAEAGRGEREAGARPTPAGPPPGAEFRPQNGVHWLHGLHAVAAALANPARRLRRLLLTAEAEAALAARLPPPWRIAAERVERSRFHTFLAEDSLHQGTALLVEPLADPGLDRAVAHTLGPVLVLDQVTDPRNVGAILRSAAGFGAAAVVLQSRHAPPETGSLARAASGALELVPMVREVNLARALLALKKAGFWVVGLDAAAPVTLAQAGLSGRRVALVLGAEGEGIRRLTRETCDELARLPIAPEVESLNVSAAASVALYELARG